MSYQATVLSIMIAAPGDTQGATKAIFKAIRNWNDTNSKKRGIVLEPAEFDAGLTSDKKESAQKKEMETIISECDILAGAFWTRTEKTSSKIKLSFSDILDGHLQNDKPALLFFSTQPVMDGSADAKKYSKFLDFKKKCKEKNLLETYDDINELLEKLDSGLERILGEEKFIVQEQTEEEVFEEPEVKAEPPVAKIDIPSPKKEPKDDVKMPTLSENAATLLKEASSDAKGLIIRRRKISDTVIKTNEKNFVQNNDMVDIIRWEAAIRELEYKGLIEDMDHSGEYYKLTGEGKLVAKLL